MIEVAQGEQVKELEQKFAQRGLEKWWSSKGEWETRVPRGD